jgi:acetyltransferase-like isoleucine patch superfamily enzyme
MTITHNDKESFRFSMSRDLQKHFDDIGIYFTGTPNQLKYAEGTNVAAPKGAFVEPFSIFITPSICKAGFGCWINSTFAPTTSIGRYCSIAPNVRVMSQNHPLDRVTSNSFTYGRWSNVHLNPIKTIGGGEITTIPFAGKPEPVLEHDVWVGQDVLLGRGITLGTGCAVAGGSVVVKDVPPYAIVGGNPAKIIRFRFPEALIERLLHSRWWRFAFPHMHDLPFHKPEEFLDKLQEKIDNNQLEEYVPEKLDIFKIVTDFYGLSS